MPDLRTTDRPLASPYGPKVTVWGNHRCVECLKLRNKLDCAGWRYRYYEVSSKTPKRIKWLEKTLEKWDGNLPVMKLNTTFESGGGWVESFEPWSIKKPKRIPQDLVRDFVWW